MSGQVSEVNPIELEAGDGGGNSVAGVGRRVG